MCVCVCMWCATVTVSRNRANDNKQCDRLIFTRDINGKEKANGKSIHFWPVWWDQAASMAVLRLKSAHQLNDYARRRPIAQCDAAQTGTMNKNNTTEITIQNIAHIHTHTQCTMQYMLANAFVSIFETHVMGFDRHEWNARTSSYTSLINIWTFIYIGCDWNEIHRMHRAFDHSGSEEESKSFN